MPNIPNTNISGQVLLSTGMQNGSAWGGSGGVSSGLGQHYIALNIETPSILSYYLRDARSFPASGVDGGAMTSIYTVPKTLGPGPWLVSSFTSSPNVLWTNVDTSASSKTITLTVFVEDDSGANAIQAVMTATIAMSGPGQSYTFGSTDWAAATVSVHGSDLAWGTAVGEVSSASGTIPYTTLLTWLLE